MTINQCKRCKHYEKPNCTVYNIGRERVTTKACCFLPKQVLLKGGKLILMDWRTEAQKKTYKWVVKAKTKGLSKENIYAGWACRTLEQAENCEKWVSGRGDTRYVTIVGDGWLSKSGRYAIHPVTPDHPYNRDFNCPTKRFKGE